MSDDPFRGPSALGAPVETLTALPQSPGEAQSPGEMSYDFQAPYDDVDPNEQRADNSA